MSEPEPFPSVDEFLFGAPLYSEYDLRPLDAEQRSFAFDLFYEALIVDGHCVGCRKASTFHRTEPKTRRLDHEDLKHIEENEPCLLMTTSCTRDEKHQIVFVFRTDNFIIQKIGQYPSLADIANDESRTYRQVLEQTDSKELHRPIGLAAHGVGVGSFVYLRRVFERLITRRFDAFKENEGWSVDNFLSRRMDEKI
jgi:hypothetical protein